MTKLLLLLAISTLSLTVFASGNQNELERRLDILAQEIQDLKAGQFQISKNESHSGLGNSASKVYGIKQGVSIGGYGEIVFHSYADEDESGADNNTDSESEVLRQIIYLGYKFNSKWILNTEIEIEHVSEIFAEFAYLDYLHSDKLSFRVGLMLVPMGFINELHEPTLFYSVDRPEVENKIIPSTWRENGFGVYGKSGKHSYKAFVVNGFNGDSLSSSGLRGGRKKGGEGESDYKLRTTTAALVLRDDVQINNALMVGGAFYHGSASTQTSTHVGISIMQAHFEYKKKAFKVRGLYVTASLDDVENHQKIDYSDNSTSASGLAEEMAGMYLEFSYDLWANKVNKSLIPFLRYETLNTQDSVPTGVSASDSNDKTNITLGLAYKPLERIIFKASYVQKSNAADTGVDEFNMSMGYQF
ncbi:MAG: hypothetical protein ACI9QD_000832 [Thermoproteota archaeon]|jgi:hypothetical protein